MTRRCFTSLWSASLLLLSLTSSQCRAAQATATVSEDWPEFRGPAKNGHSSAVGLPVKWSKDKNIVWRAALPGKAWSSPIVIGGRIYLTNAVAEKNEADPHDTRILQVLALDAATGQQVWQTDIFSVPDPAGIGEHQKNSFASPTPIYEDGKIYTHFGHMGTACVDTEGKIVWKTQELAYKPVHGNGGCPVIAGNLLIFNVDAADHPYVAALDKTTGQVAWKTPRVGKARKTFSFCTPLLIDVKGETQLITPGSDEVSALRPTDGSEIWRLRYDGYSVVPRPVYGNGLIYMSTGFDRPIALAIRPDGKGDVTDTALAWSIAKQAPLTPSMLLVGADLYMVADKGLLSCVDAKSGQVRWQERVSGPCSASPLFAEGRIYIQDEKGVGYVIKPGPKLEVLSVNDLGEPSLASYAVWGSNLIIRTQAAVYCVGAKS